MRGGWEVAGVGGTEEGVKRGGRRWVGVFSEGGLSGVQAGGRRPGCECRSTISWKSSNETADEPRKAATVSPTTKPAIVSRSN